MNANLMEGQHVEMQKCNHYLQLLLDSMEYSHSVLQHPWNQPEEMNETTYYLYGFWQKKKIVIWLNEIQGPIYLGKDEPNK